MLGEWLRHWTIPLGCVILFSWTTVPTRSADSVYTDTQRNCRTIEQSEAVRIWRCKGPGGYSSLFSDEGNVIAVEYGPTGEEKNLGGLQWPGADPAIGPKVEWRVEGKKPYAAILRITIREEEVSKQYLLVAKVAERGSCRIGLIAARQVGANARARHTADKLGRVHICAQ
jgi:hypothetical protein